MNFDLRPGIAAIGLITYALQQQRVGIQVVEFQLQASRGAELNRVGYLINVVMGTLGIAGLSVIQDETTAGSGTMDRVLP